MKANASQIGSAIDRIGGAGAGDLRLFLLHGPDESTAGELAARVGRAAGPGAERIDLDGGMLKARPGVLADEAASLSLFGDRRWIRVTGVGEESLDAIEMLLTASTAGNPVVAIGSSLKATGKLVKLATASSAALVHACYAPDAAQAARNTAAMARERGVRLMADVAAALVDASAGDRAVIASEIEKLALYLDAAPDHPREADLSVLDAIGANLDDSGMFGAIEAVVDGRPGDLGSEQAQLDPNMAIPLLRQLAKRLISLAEMRVEVETGSSASEVVERRRIFWKEKGATTRALHRWSSSQLSAAVTRVRRAEHAVFQSGNVGAIVTDAECLAIARAAARL